MAFTDTFSSAPIQAGIPPKWEIIPTGWPVDADILEDLTAIGSRTLRFLTVQGYHGVTRLINARIQDGAEASSIINILALVQVTEPNPIGLGPAIFVTFDGTRFNGSVSFGPNVTDDQVGIVQFGGLGGGSTTAAFQANVGDKVWLRLHVNTITGIASARAWHGSVYDEPSTWLINNFSVWSIQGKQCRAGLGVHLHDQRFGCEYFAAAYSGAVAPPPPDVEEPGPISFIAGVTEYELVSGTRVISWGASPHSALYRLERLVGGAWVPLTVTSNTQFSWNTAPINWSRTQLRVRGENSLGETEWVLTPEFIVWQGQIDQITGFAVANRTAFSVMVAVNDTAGLRVVEAQLDNIDGDFSAPIVTLASVANVSPEIVWLPVPLPDTRYRVRVRVQYQDLSWSNWMTPRTFRSINLPLPPGPMDAGGAYYTTDFLSGKKSVLGDNPTIQHSYLDPKIVPVAKVEFGVDLQGYYGVNYKTRGVRVRGQSNATRDVFTRIPDNGEYWQSGSIIMAFIPTQATPMELMGVGDLYMSTQGSLVKLNTSARPTVSDRTMEEHIVGHMNIGRLNVLGMSWIQPVMPPSYGAIDPCSCRIISSPGAIIEVTLNGIHNRRVIVERPADYKPETRCGKSLSCPTRWEELNVRYLDFGRGSPWSFEWASDIGGNGRTLRGILVEALAFKTALPAGTMGAMANAILAGGPNTDSTILNFGSNAWLRFNEYPAPMKPVVNARPVEDLS